MPMRAAAGVRRTAPLFASAGPTAGFSTAEALLSFDQFGLVHVAGRAGHYSEAMPPTPTATSLALKEWAAVVHALLQGRQTVLLRKGGIHEKRFDIPSGTAAVDAPVVLFPTVAHSHGERVRPEHRDLLALGASDVREGSFMVRCGIILADVVEVRRPERLDTILDTHIWTSASVTEDRVSFRPRVPLQALVVRAFALPRPVLLPRDPAHAGCRSWLDLPVPWDARSGRQILDDAALREVTERVRDAVG